MHDANEGINKVPIIIALVLAILLVVGVIVGARMVADRAYQTPVAIAEVDSPAAGSSECGDFIAAMPTTVIGLRRAVIADPAPAGVAVWQKTASRQITVRCGVAAPAQLTDLSQLEEVAGTKWLQVVDTTPGSTLQTWYATDRDKVVAVTADGEALQSHSMPEVITTFSDALAALPAGSANRSPIPLSELPAAEGEDTSKCNGLLSTLPATINAGGTQYSRAKQPSGTPELAAWTAPGAEPIVVRCGVEFPTAYEAGARLSQVNDTPWFEDTTLGNGTTASVWYAVDAHPVVVLSTPQAAAQSALVQVSQAIRSKL